MYGINYIVCASRFNRNMLSRIVFECVWDVSDWLSYSFLVCICAIYADRITATTWKIDSKRINGKNQDLSLVCCYLFRVYCMYRICMNKRIFLTLELKMLCKVQTWLLRNIILHIYIYRVSQKDGSIPGSVL